MYMFILGTMKSHGLLYIEMVEYYSSGSGNTAWVGSMAWLFLRILGIKSVLIIFLGVFI